jgi:RNA polymerase sigma factor (sigma-70 family)
MDGEPERATMSELFRDISAKFLADQHTLMAFIHAMLHDYHVSQDIFQETWLQLVDAMEKGVEIRDVQKWSRGAARNLILKHWRAQRSGAGGLVVVNSELLDLAAAAFEEQDSRSEYWETRRRALSDCMAQLPPQSREILVLKYERQLSAAAVAKRLHKTAEAVLMILSRLRKLLARCTDDKIKALDHGNS